MTNIETKSQVSGGAWSALLIAWLIALASSLGALFIGEIMGQAPCSLCWFQRTFMFPLAIILGLATYRSDRSVLPYALALAAVGGAIALYHFLLYAGVITEAIQPCGAGPSCSDAAMTVLGSVPIPLLSLVAFAAISLFLIPLTWRSKS